MIYFIEAVGSGLVRIGKTNDVRHRLRQHRIHNHCEVRLLKTLPGYTRAEAYLFERWAEHRVRGDWFRLDPIREELEQLQAIPIDGPDEPTERSPVYPRLSDVDPPTWSRGSPVVSVRLPPALAERLQTYTDRGGVTLTEAVRELLEKSI